MANWEKLIEEHYEKKNKIDAQTIYELVEQVLLEEGYQDSDIIKKHSSMRLSTKGTKKAGGDPFDEEPPKERSKSAPAGFGVLEEESEDLEEAALSRSLTRTPQGFKHFLQKIRNGEEFELVGGGTIKIDSKSKEYIDYVVRNEKVPSKVKLFSPDGKSFSLSALQKTKDFGSTSGVIPMPSLVRKWIQLVLRAIYNMGFSWLLVQRKRLRNLGNGQKKITKLFVLQQLLRQESQLERL